jgi:hypothetical protein
MTKTDDSHRDNIHNGAANTLAGADIPPGAEGLTAAESSATNDASDGNDADNADMARELQKLQEQLEAVRKEAYEDGFAAGYASAVDLLRRHKPNASPTTHEQTDLSEVIRKPMEAMPRGMSAIIIQEILQTIAPRAATPKQIYDLAKERGSYVNQNSVPRVLRRLADQGSVEQVPNTTAWKCITKPRLVGS